MDDSRTVGKPNSTKCDRNMKIKHIQATRNAIEGGED